MLSMPLRIQSKAFYRIVSRIGMEKIEVALGMMHMAAGSNRELTGSRLHIE
jgi:hypothetical protein